MLYMYFTNQQRMSLVGELGDRCDESLHVEFLAY